MPTPIGPGGAADWQNQPTTDASEAETVAIVTSKEGQQTGADFKIWYDNARVKDPSITPNQAVAAFLTGYGIAKATGTLTSFLGEVPVAAAGAANNLLKNPLGFLADIANFFNKLGQANTWLRIGEAVAGFLLLALGLNALLHNPAGKVIRTVR